MQASGLSETEANDRVAIQLPQQHPISRGIGRSSERREGSLLLTEASFSEHGRRGGHHVQGRLFCARSGCGYDCQEQVEGARVGTSRAI
jgi:hypothetical protein